MFAYWRSPLGRLCLLDAGKILDGGGEMRCNLEKHVLCCPLGIAHVQTPNARVIPAASPVSSSSVLHQGFSLRHISSVRRRGEPRRRGLWRMAPAGPDGLLSDDKLLIQNERKIQSALSLSPHISLVFFSLAMQRQPWSLLIYHETGSQDHPLQNCVKSVFWLMWDWAVFLHVILRFMAAYRS